MLLDIFTFLGRLHPLVVHLPIGFLLLAILFELLTFTNRYAYLKPAVSSIVLLGFLAAVFSCIFGYMLSLGGDYDYQQINNHKIAGIAVALLAGILYLFTTSYFRNKIRLTPKLFSVLCIGLFGLLTYTGHLGGNLTHGNDYLSLQVLKETERKKPASLNEAMLFEDVVQPIIKNKCGQCHREGKLKGQFSVQSLASLLKGGKTRAAVVAGNLPQSELYTRITLDPTQKKFMPADGKPPLTAEETAIITWWIDKGRALSGIKFSELKNADLIKPLAAQWLGLAFDENTVPTEAGTVVNTAIPASFNPQLLDSLRKAGLRVRLMAHQPVMLDITLPAGAKINLPLVQSALKNVAKHVVWLNLSGNGLTESDLNFLPALSNLEKLRLDRNPLSDGICDMVANLQQLQSINLSETKLTRAGAEKLKKMPGLKSAYYWKTAAE
jgi:uncharacterized membrane protein